MTLVGIRTSETTVSFTRPTPEDLKLNMTAPRELYIRQIDSEYTQREERYTQIMKELTTAASEGKESNTAYGSLLIGKSIDEFAEALTAYHTAPKRGKPPIVHEVFGYMPDTRVIATIVLNTCVDRISSERPLATIALEIAKNLQDEINFLRLEGVDVNTFRRATANVATKSRIHEKRASLRWFLKNAAGIPVFTWPDNEKMAIGHALIVLLNNHFGWCEVSTETTRDLRGKTTRRAYLRANPELDRWIHECRHELALTLLPQRQPLLVPPRPWTNESLHCGAYLTQASPALSIVKTRNTRYLQQLRHVEMAGVLNAVNRIQETPLVINKEVLQWREYFRDNTVAWSEYIGIPLNEARLLSESVQRSAACDTDSETLFFYQQACTAFHKAEAVNRSKRMSHALMLGLARKYAGEDNFYVPWQGDSRMRVYATSKLNFQGTDSTKALLLFSEAVPLGTHGLKWLEIHAANLWGIDKLSFDERLQWVSENKEHILRLADDPLDSRGFWSEADEPWQALAVALELKQAWSTEDPSTFLSRIPVSLDGSCSGLQILGSALRCENTGGHVNLMATDKPADIYGVIAALVEKELRELVGERTHAQVLKLAKKKAYELWATSVTDTTHSQWLKMLKSITVQTTKEDDKLLKVLRKVYFKYTEAYAWLQFGVDRKTVKRNVMTYCYGSARFGFGEQCMEDILRPAYREHRKALAGGLPSSWHFDGNGGRAASLLASHVYPAVERTVLRAAQAMKWLQKTATLIAKQNRPLRWTSPHGFPVLQEYRKTKERQVNCKMMGKRTVLSIREESLDYDAVKAASAIAPNVVHSLDAAHLQSVVNMAYEEHGITAFALVHDSFGTHAGNTEVFFKVIRDALIKLFTERDVFDELRKEFTAQLAPELQDLMPDLPEYGSLDLNSVRDSLYAFA
ncbi:DNA-directed RNA polymerase [Candidatus Enterovibrio escicola]|uniref:DNA-directed RNA polymerase n=1 Tax=Candidatus Enterovibrio escicola TaxID=1927127 RepID=UPI001237D592|nr:DNA-directed RNA polymerase [Candidatus Enterovibrio escacola]